MSVDAAETALISSHGPTVDEEKVHEMVGQGVKTLKHVVKRVGDTATVSARIIGNSNVAKGAAAATAEAARFALDRTCEAFEKATDPNYGAFWEPRVDRFSMIPWYERQLVEETCELPIDDSPALFSMLRLPKKVPANCGDELEQRQQRDQETKKCHVQKSSEITLPLPPAGPPPWNAVRGPVQQPKQTTPQNETQQRGQSAQNNGSSSSGDNESADILPAAVQSVDSSCQWHVVGTNESTGRNKTPVPADNYAKLNQIQSLEDVKIGPPTSLLSKADASNEKVTTPKPLSNPEKLNLLNLDSSSQCKQEMAEDKTHGRKEIGRGPYDRVAVVTQQPQLFTPGVLPPLHSSGDGFGFDDKDGSKSAALVNNDDDNDDDDAYAEARAEDEAYRQAVQCIAAPPLWREAAECAACRRPFGLTRYRHHCRACGGSFCHAHSSARKELPRLGFLTPVRVCDGCHKGLSFVEKAQRVQWRLTRLDAYRRGKLIPYFDLAVDTHVHKARRVLEGTLFVARRAPLGASATIAVEVMDILWKYGPPGLAGLVLRREFIEAAELLRKVSALEQSWPLSAHELMAAMYYLLALKRGERGNQPDLEADEHEKARLDRSRASPLSTTQLDAVSSLPSPSESKDTSNSESWVDTQNGGGSEVTSHEIREILEIAPFALHFVYGHTPPEMQLRAAQKGFWLIFCNTESALEKPAFSLFACPGNEADANSADASSRLPRAILSVRGTNDIYDVVTDLRTMPIPFPPIKDESALALSEQQKENGQDKQPFSPCAAPLPSFPSSKQSPTASSQSAQSAQKAQSGRSPPDWASADGKARTMAVEGMARAAMWLADEVMPVLRGLVADGYELVLTGHSLGGAVAVLLSFLVRQRIPNAKVTCITFGSPSCMDETLAAQCAAWTTSVVLHDDVIPRITHTSVRDLVKELLRQRECCMGLWHSDLEAVWGRVCGFWSPRWRDSFLRGQNSRDAPYSVSAKGLRSPAAGFEGISALPTHLERDGASIRNNFLLANAERAAATKSSPPPSSASSSVKEALERDLQQRNELLARYRNNKWSDKADGNITAPEPPTPIPPKRQRKKLKVGDAVKAWGIMANETGIDNAKLPATTNDDRNLDDDTEDIFGLGFGSKTNATRKQNDSAIDDDTSLDDDDTQLRKADKIVASIKKNQNATNLVNAVGPERTHSDDDVDSDDETDSDDESIDSVIGKNSNATTLTSPAAESPAASCADGGGGGIGLTILADDNFGQQQAGWYDGRVSHVCNDGTYGVVFEDTNVHPAVLGTNGTSLPAALVRLIGEDEGQMSLEEEISRIEIGKEQEEGKIDSSSTQMPPDMIISNHGIIKGSNDDLGCVDGRALESNGPLSPTTSQEETASGTTNVGGTIVIDDLELPVLRVPGRVVHIYSQRGVYRASNLSRDSPLLTSIRMYGNMLKDHGANSYFSSLCEVLDVISAPSSPPKWVPFTASNFCQCCRAEFSWHSTARNLTAKCRDKHNCRCCGKLVCDPCSRSRRTVPRLGLNTAVRVCDRCFFDAAALSQQATENIGER